MSAQCEVTAKQAAGSPMSLFERYLTMWVGLCIAIGITLGHWFPGPFQAIGEMEVAQVNLPVAVLIWLMIIPMLLKVDFGTLHHVQEHWRGIGVTLFINWAVKPFSFAVLGWLFIRGVFLNYLPADQLDSYKDYLAQACAKHGTRTIEHRWNQNQAKHHSCKPDRRLRADNTDKQSVLKTTIGQTKWQFA